MGHSFLSWIRKEEIEVLLELMGKAISSLVVRHSFEKLGGRLFAGMPEERLCFCWALLVLTG